MKLSEINIDNITNEIIEKVLFQTPTSKYEEADCLIVFGCHLRPLLEERIKRTIELYNTKKINKILLTGGIGVKGDFNEAEFMKEQLVAANIKEDMILVENKATTTTENIKYSLSLLKEHDLIENKKIALVSSQAHLRRIGMELKQYLKATPTELLYEYPKDSCISFENVIKKDELKILAINEVKKIVEWVKLGIIEDETIDGESIIQ